MQEDIQETLTAEGYVAERALAPPQWETVTPHPSRGLVKLYCVLGGTCLEPILSSDRDIIYHEPGAKPKDGDIIVVKWPDEVVVEYIARTGKQTVAYGAKLFKHFGGIDWLVSREGIDRIANVELVGVVRAVVRNPSSSLAPAGPIVIAGQLGAVAASQIVSASGNTTFPTAYPATPVVNSALFAAGITGCLGSLPVAVDVNLYPSLLFQSGTTSWAASLQVVSQHGTSSVVTSYSSATSLASSAHVVQLSPFCFTYVDPNPAVGTNTYTLTLNMSCVGSGSYIVWGQVPVQMKIREIRR